MSGYTRYFGSSEILGVHLKYCNYHKFAYYPIFWVTWYQTTFKNELGWDGYWKQFRVAGHWVVPLFTPLYRQKIRKAIFKIFSIRLNLQNRLGGGWFLVMISKPAFVKANEERYWQKEKVAMAWLTVRDWLWWTLYCLSFPLWPAATKSCQTLSRPKCLHHCQLGPTTSKTPTALHTHLHCIICKIFGS